jgi:hypothetical protein
MAAKPGKKQLENNVVAALAARDRAAVLEALGQGLSPAWQDEKGRGLLHYAAAFGDAALAESLLAKGVSSLRRDGDLNSAQDVAAAYGHDGLAQKFAAAMAREAAAAAQSPLPYKTLQDLRDAGAKDGVNHFYRLAREGRFADVIRLAKTGGKGFEAQDLLSRGSNGDTVVQVLAAQGQVAGLLDTALWLKNGAGFQAVWQNVPAAAKAGLAADGFMAQLRQARLESYVRPELKRAPRLKPKGPKDAKK